MKNFTNLYQLQKTLRFELKPISKTREHIETKGLLSQDEQRAESYKKAKKIIDEYHKEIIDEALNGALISELEEYQTLYFKTNKSDNETKELGAIKTRMRKQVAARFTKNPDKTIKKKYQNLFKKELIKNDLLEWLEDEDDKKVINEFKQFTTYFTGFHENRRNMYSADEKSTAIAYRIIHDNLPRFLDNIRVFKKIVKNYSDFNWGDLEKELEPVLQGIRVEEFFELEHFNECLTQTGMDQYNVLLGGVKEGTEKQTKGLNGYINEYRQRGKRSDGKKLTKKDIPNLVPLYKQILSDRDSVSFLPDTFEQDAEVLDSLQKFYDEEIHSWKLNDIRLFDAIKKLYKSINDYDLSKIYIRNDVSLTHISQAVFGDWVIIKNALKNYYEQVENPIGNRKRTKKYDLDLEKYVSKAKYHSIETIENALWLYKNESIDAKNKITEHTLCDYFKKFDHKKRKDDKEKTVNCFEAIKTAYEKLKVLLLSDYPKDKNLMQDTANIEKIKHFLDSIKELLWFVKPLHIGYAVEDKDDGFYNEYIELFDQLKKITKLYDKVRNYLTRKPYKTEKIKLNFENKGQFLGGWVDSHTENSDNATQSGGYLFRKLNEIDEYDYFIGISSDLKLFRSHLQNEISKEDKSEYERLDYYQIKTTSIYGSSYVGDYNKDKSELTSIILKTINNSVAHSELETYFEKDTATPKGALSILQDEKYKELYEKLVQSEAFKSKNEEVIKNLRKTLEGVSRVPKAQELAEKKYKLFTEVINDIENLATEKIFNYFPIDQNELSEALERQEKPLLLFKITNKDLSFAETYLAGKRKKERGKDNLHTIYFKSLMSGDQNVYDLGTGQVFFREKSISYSEDILKKGHHQSKLKDKFGYPIISNKRFVYDKFQFHLSIVLNYQQPKLFKIFNQKVNQYLQHNPDVNIIGIDRGERHLLYVSVIDQKGNIKEQFSLNEIVNEHKGTRYGTDYHSLLAKKEEERKQARVNWGAIQNIKELKEGYISQVVHKIVRLMVKYNAIVVMEDFNSGFKRGRQKVEKQVYQKFEKMLIDKLNYLVFKDKPPKELGGTLNALQLTNKFESFKKLGKQSGFIFYVPAWNTSKIDPATGFVNLFYTKYESIIKAQEFFSGFESIRYNDSDRSFAFSFNYNNGFTSKAEGTKTEWTVVADNRNRYRWNRSLANGKGDYEEIKVAERLIELFDEHSIDYKDEEDLKDRITAVNEAAFYKTLLYLFSTLTSLRHNNGKKGEAEEDKILSPVTPFFDSSEENGELPDNADANGAYHIALKGLWVLHQINQTDENKLGKPKLAISNKEWLNWVQKRPFEN